MRCLSSKSIYPATAIGKDYLGRAIVGTAPSGSGVQLSLGGVLGVAVGPVDGLEFNVLGLNFGVNSNGLKLPMVGRVGSSPSPSPASGRDTTEGTGDEPMTLPARPT